MAWPAGATLVVPEPGPVAGEMLAVKLNELRVSHAPDHSDRAGQRPGRASTRF